MQENNNKKNIVMATFVKNTFSPVDVLILLNM